MRKKTIIILISFLGVLGTIFGVKSLFKNDPKPKNKYININDVSDEFMDNYYNGVAKLNEIDNQENILIITSMEKPTNDYGASYVVEGPNHQYYFQYDNEDDMNSAKEKFEQDETIDYVDNNYFFELLDVQEPSYDSWGIQAMGLDHTNDILYDYENVKDVVVAIIDTGLDMGIANAAYPGKLVETYNAHTDTISDISDTNGHGTHIFGTIAEGTPDNVGILSVYLPTIENIFGQEGFSDLDIAAAINYLTREEKADVVNLSLGGSSISNSFRLAIEAGTDEGIVFVAASGNSGHKKTGVEYPAKLDSTIAVAALDSNYEVAYFSSYGPEVDYSAPGVNISSLCISPNASTCRTAKSGTSMATPHVVSAVAAIKSIDNDLNKDQVEEILDNFAMDFGDTNHYGRGFINLSEAQLCDGNNCDNYDVFKDHNYEYDSISIDNITFTDLNYLSINNILNSEVTFTYGSKTVTRKLLDFDDAYINGYDPTSTEIQEVEIGIDNLSTTVNIQNPTGYNTDSKLVYEYQYLDDDTVEITAYKNKSSENLIKKLYLPEKINNHNVVRIADSTDSQASIFGNTRANEIYLPDTLTYIGAYAFYNNAFLQRIASQTETIEIGDFAFQSNKSLKYFDVEATSITIDESAFEFCESLTDFGNSNPNLTLSVGAYAFGNCKLLKNIYGTIVSLSEGAFRSAESLNNITLSDSITEIPDFAFEACYDLHSFTLPSETTFIGFGAFSHSGLSSLTFNEKLETIDDFAFVRTYVSTVDFPDSLQSIGENAFADCDIVNLNIPANVDEIGIEAFVNNYDLTNISVDENNTTFDSRDDCNAIIDTEYNALIQGSYNTTIPSSVEIIGPSAFEGIQLPSRIVIPEGVVEVWNRAFYCSYAHCGLGSLVVPTSVEYLGPSALGYPGVEPSDIEDEEEEEEYSFKLYPDTDNCVDDYCDDYNNLLDHPDGENGIVIYTYEDTYTADYLRNSTAEYVIMNSSGVDVTTSNNSYTILDSVSLSDIEKIQVYYPVGKWHLFYSEDGYGFHRYFQFEHFLSDENIDEYEIIYPTANDHFVDGDTYYTVKGYNKYGLEFETQVDVTVSKPLPEYTIPTNLQGVVGYTLSAVDLPSGFSWNNVNQEITSGENYYEATFTPTDTENYAIVSPVLIPVYGKSPIIFTPVITLPDIEYGKTNLSQTDFTIEGIGQTLYSFEFLGIDNTNVGARNATVKLTLHEAFRYEYSLDGDVDSKEYTVPFNILPKRMDEPTKVDCILPYTGDNYDFKDYIRGFNSETMDISNTIQKEIGEYEVTITPKSNYGWNNIYEYAIKLTFNIIPIMVPKPYEASNGYAYSENCRQFEIGDYDDTKVNIDITSGCEVGIYTPKVSLIDPEHSVWGDFTTDDYYLNFEIKPKVIFKPTQSTVTTYEYTEDVINFAMSGYDSEFMDISNEYGINPGQYITTIKLKNPNYIWDDETTDDVEFVYEILPQKVIKPAQSATTQYEYTGEEIEFEILNNESDKYTISNSSGTNVGNYTTVISLINSNYIWDDYSTNDLNFDYEITPHLLNKPSKNSDEYYFKEAGQEFYITWFDDQFMDKTPSFGTNVGTYKVTVSLKDPVNCHWSDNTTTPIELEFEILPIRLNKPTLNKTSYVYDYMFPLYFDCTDCNAFGTGMIVEENYNNAGHHTLKFSLDNPGNYVWVDGTTDDILYEYDVLPMAVSYPSTVRSTSDSYIYKYTGNTILFDYYGISTSTLNISNDFGTNVGKYKVKFSLKNSNFIWTDGTTNDYYLEFEIGKADLKVIDSSSDITVNYDGQEHYPNINYSIQNGVSSSILYKDSNGNYILSDKPSFKEIGNHRVDYMIYSSNGNYEKYYGTVYVNISNNVIKTSVNNYEGIYDGKNHSASIKATNVNGTITYSLDGKSYNLKSNPSFSDIGDHKVYYKISASGYGDTYGTVYVKIYGIKDLGKDKIVHNNNILINSNNFNLLTNNISVYGNNVKYEHLNYKGETAQYNEIKTGDYLVVKTNNSVIAKYQLSYLGDTSGDGKINYLDYVNVYNHIQKTKNSSSDKKLLVDAYLDAADINQDKKVNYLDYVGIYNKIKELKGGK